MIFLVPNANQKIRLLSLVFLWRGGGQFCLTAEGASCLATRVVSSAVYTRRLLACFEAQNSCRPNEPEALTATASKHCSPQGLVSGQVVGPSTHGSVSVRGEVGVHTAVHRVTYTNQTGNTPWAPTTGRTEKLPFCWGGAQYIYIYICFGVHSRLGCSRT